MYIRGEIYTRDLLRTVKTKKSEQVFFPLPVKSFEVFFSFRAVKLATSKKRSNLHDRAETGVLQTTLDRHLDLLELDALQRRLHLILNLRLFLHLASRLLLRF